MNYLSNLIVSENKGENIFPYNLPIFKNGLKMEFKKPITFIIGDNGTGKSTLLESIAYKIGFNVLGGNKNHSYYNSKVNDNLKLADNMKLIWDNKTSNGFFFRAESFLNFSEYLEDMAIENGKGMFSAYGGKSLIKQSHGESFLALFQNKFQDGIFILDEPEAALSAERQLSLIAIISDLCRSGKCQFIIATHSPLLITLPNSQIYEVNGDKLEQKKYDETKQFSLYKNYLNAPEKYLKYLVEE